ncbi:arginine methyltransferase 1-related [Anaeramoeba flamelloides]|uniref:type I protein arginine methyltransferase n=1 Tax=Anaeramoeba flamelloides TaxID=1746091 RepID=A0AAV7YFL5_9EUKA|nr:arginine methyltransferase 1-related [Anaeramoeba flamelloides]KAJ6238487.1 arginine methyltransferase 1-related [Anaeramoeba flamelloides]
MENTQKDLEQKNKELTSKDYYFDSYSHYGIHEEMLKDEVRTGSYYRAIINNKHLFKDKIVMDVGCGTGILSMFAAKAGAKKVIAIDFSNIIDHTNEIIKENGYADVIKVIHKKVEDIGELPEGIEKVDVIISEWMGYCLLYESMLNTVIYARDKWLTEEGIILPDKASLFIGGIEDSNYNNEKLEYWENVWGFKMTSIKKAVNIEPVIDIIEEKHVVTNYHELKQIDIKTVTLEELELKAPFLLQCDRNEYINGFVTFFTYTFSKCHVPITISTGPESTYTHWKQCIFFIKEPLTVYKDETVKGIFKLKQNNKNNRDLDISIKYVFNGEISKVAEKQKYRLR